MSNSDKKSTGNREFSGNCLYILYIKGQFTVHCGFSVNLRAIDSFYGIYGIFPGKFADGKCPVFSFIYLFFYLFIYLLIYFKSRGFFRQQISRGIYRKSRKNCQLSVNLRKIRKLDRLYIKCTGTFP